MVVGTPGIAPDDGVVTDDAARGVVQGAHDRVPGVRRDVQAGGLLLYLLRVNDAGVDALELVDLGSPVHGPQRSVGVGQGEMAPPREHDVQVQVGGHRVVQVQRPVVEGHALRCEVVGADDGRVASGAATTDVALVDDGHVCDAVVLGEVVSGGQAVETTTYDDDVVRVAHLRATPHPWPVTPGQAVLDERAC